MTTAKKTDARTALLTLDTSSMTMDQLIEHRGYLSAFADSDGAFPGSAAWRRAQPFFAAWQSFDAARPEVLTEINRRHAARFAGVDVMGI
jgi:hypothetical protein